MKNNSGKVLTIFLIIIAVLLMSTAALTIFFLQKEIERRKASELLVEKAQANESKLEQALKEAKKLSFVLQEKNKELDERINGLLDEIELEKGLKEELKSETVSLKDQIEKEIQEREGLRSRLDQELMASEKKIIELQNNLKEALAGRKELDILNQQLSEKFAQLERQYEEVLADKVQLEQDRNARPVMTPTPKPVQMQPLSSMPESLPVMEKSKQMSSKEIKEKVSGLDVELDAIVVVPGATKKMDDQSMGDNLDGAPPEVEEAMVVMAPGEVPEGRVLSVDKDTEFVIVNLGKKDGLTKGMYFSVYRGKDYLGDIQITRIQSEMAAADLIPPFSIQTVRKNDQVVIKK